MSTIIVITPPPTKPNRVQEGTATTEVKKIRLVLESEGSLADQLRAAADLLDGNG